MTLMLLWVMWIVWLFIDPWPAAITGMSIGVIAIVLFWYWMHTWPLHAWSDDRWAFWKLVLRRLM